MKKLILTFSLIALTSTIKAQWVAQNSGFTTASRGIDEIRIIDANTVWCYGYDGVTTANVVQEFTRTTDGGNNWVFGNIDLGDPTLKIGNMDAISATTAWVSAFNETSGQGGAWRTTDSGVTWTQQTTDFTGATSWCDGVHFFNATTGIAFGDPSSSTATTLEMYRTTDGGNTWSSVSSPAINAGDFGYAGSFAYYGNSMWIGTAKGKVYRTSDAGATWTKLNSPISDFGAGDTTTSSGKLFFSDANNGILISSTLSGTGATATVTGRKLYKTTNGGTNWGTSVNYTSPYNYNLAYVPGTNILVGTGAATSGATTTYSSGYSLDNASTWTQIDSGTQRTTIAFLNPTTGWAGGFSDVDPLVVAGIFKFSGNLATPSFDSASKFKVYPNPTNSNVTIAATQDVDSFNLSVTDLTGKILMTKSLNGIENTLDISNLSSGIYFFELSSNNKKEVVKILKN